MWKAKYYSIGCLNQSGLGGLALSLRTRGVPVKTVWGEIVMIDAFNHGLRRLIVKKKVAV